MGNLPCDEYHQNTYKICELCDDNEYYNSNLMILNIFNYDYHQKLLLRCSKGHKVYYKGSKKHISYCIDYIKNNSSYYNSNSKQNIIKEKNIKINELKNKIHTCWK